MNFVANMLAVRDSTMEIIMVVVFLVIGLIGQAIKKATERQQQRQQRRPQRRAPRPKPQPGPTRVAQPMATPPRKPAQPQPRQAPAVDPRPELRVRLGKLRAKIEQEQRHLAHMQAQQRELQRLLEPGPELEVVELDESHRVVADAGAVGAAVAAAVGPPAVAGRVSLAGRDRLRQAILHYEILSPPVALRESHGMWDR